MPVKLKMAIGIALIGKTDEKVREHMKVTCNASSLHLAKLMLHAGSNLEQVALRTLCSLLAGQDLKTIRIKALHALHFGASTPEQDTASAQVLATSLCSLLSRDVFVAHSTASTQQLFNLTQDIILRGEETNLSQWMHLIEKKWGESSGESLTDALAKRLSELALSKIHNNRPPTPDRQIDLAKRVIQHCFFDVDKELSQKIVNRVLNRLGGFND